MPNHRCPPLLRRPKTDKHDTPSPNGPHRLLVVDDNPDAARLISKLLRAAGFEVAEVNDQSIALATLLNEPEPISGVIASFSSAGTPAALKLLESIRAHRDARVHRVKVITILDQPKQQLFTWQSGADGVLVRPFHSSDLVSTASDAATRPDSERARHRRDRVKELSDLGTSPETVADVAFSR